MSTPGTEFYNQLVSLQCHFHAKFISAGVGQLNLVCQLWAKENVCLFQGEAFVRFVLKKKKKKKKIVFKVEQNCKYNSSEFAITSTSHTICTTTDW